MSVPRQSRLVTPVRLCAHSIYVARMPAVRWVLADEQHTIGASRRNERRSPRLGERHMREVRPEGFEPPTPWSEATCSGPLSYGRMKEERGVSEGIRTPDLQGHNLAR